MTNSRLDEPTAAVRLFASITSLSPLTVGADGRRLVAAGVDGIHVDIADGHFAPVLLFPPAVAWKLRQDLGISVEAHLMVDEPEAYLPVLARHGVDRVAFHLESTRHPWRVAALARELGVDVGLAINPVTPIEVLERLGNAIDYVNLLAADHDVPHDRFLAATPGRVRWARSLVAEGVRVQVDGGVDSDNAASLVAAGAHDLVVGRAISDWPDWTLRVALMRAAMVRAGAADEAARS